MEDFFPAVQCFFKGSDLIASNLPILKGFVGVGRASFSLRFSRLAEMPLVGRLAIVQAVDVLLRSR